MAVTLRAARAHDLAAVLALWREAQAEPSRTDDFESLGRLLDHDAQSLIVAQDGERIVGTVIAGWDGWRGSVYRLAVAPDHRRRGLGTRLLREAESRLTTAGGVRFHAVVVEHDRPAMGFWRASGWEQQAERARFVWG